MKHDASLIFRTTSSKDGELNENDQFIKDIFTIKKIIHQEKNGLLISVLLKKK